MGWWTQSKDWTIPNVTYHHQNTTELYATPVWHLPGTNEVPVADAILFSWHAIFVQVFDGDSEFDGSLPEHDWHLQSSLLQDCPSDGVLIHTLPARLLSPEI